MKKLNIKINFWIVSLVIISAVVAAQLPKSAWAVDEETADQAPPDLKAENFRLQGQLVALKSEVSSLLIDKSTLESKAYQLDSQVQAQIKLNEELRRKIDDLKAFESEKEMLDQHIESVQNELKARDEEMLALEQAKEVSENELESFKRTLEDGQKEVAQNRDYIIQLETVNKDLEAELNELKSQAQLIGKEAEGMRAKVGADQKEKAALALEVKALKDEKGRLINSTKELEKNFTSLQKEIQELNKKHKKLVAKDSDNLIASLEIATKELALQKKENATAHYNLGTLYMKAGQHREAAKEFEYVLKAEPSHAFAHFNLALVYDTYLSKPKEAIAHYAEYVRLLPDARDSREVKFRLFQLRTIEQKGIGRDLTQDKI